MSDNLQLSRGGNLALASGALANGSTAGTVQTTATIPFTIDGVFFSKAATNNIPFAIAGLSAVYGQATDGSFTGAVGGSTRLYGLYMNTAGTVTAFPGPIVNSAELAAGTAPLHFPQPQKGLVCFGVVRIAVTASTTFVPGTTALNAAGVTTTYLNLAQLPGEPLKA
jgi:hypothetical protein